MGTKKKNVEKTQVNNIIIQDEKNQSINVTDNVGETTTNVEPDNYTTANAEEKNEGVLTLAEVIEKCESFAYGKIDKNDFNEWIKQIKVIPYMNLEDKVLKIMEILFKQKFEIQNDIGLNLMEIERYKFWNVLLSYTNIVVDEEDFDNLKTLNNYNLLMPLIGNAIELQCYVDYTRFDRMLTNTLNISNAEQLMEFLSNIKDIDLDNAWSKIEEKIKYIDENKEEVSKLLKLTHLT